MPKWFTAGSRERELGVEPADQEHEAGGVLAARARGGSSVSASSSAAAGANGRNGSRNLIFSLIRSFISAWRGSARMLRLPSARGPNSKRPWNQPTTVARGERVDGLREHRCLVGELAVLDAPAALERRRDLRRRVVASPSRRARVGRARVRPSTTCSTYSAAPSAAAGVAGRRADEQLARTGLARIRPFAIAFSATPPAKHRFVEPVRRCAARARLTTARSVTSWTLAAMSAYRWLRVLAGHERPRRALSRGPARRAARSSLSVKALPRRVVEREVVHVEPEAAVARTCRRTRETSSTYRGSPYGRHAHDLVLALVHLEAEEGGEGRVEEAERVREVDLPNRSRAGARRSPRPPDRSSPSPTRRRRRP